MTASTPRKPAGGITAAAITPAGNLLRAALGADGRAEAVFRDGTLLTRLPLAEQRSSYTELSDTQAGPHRVRHTLKLVVSREAARTLFDPAFRRTAAVHLCSLLRIQVRQRPFLPYILHLIKNRVPK